MPLGLFGNSEQGWTANLLNLVVMFILFYFLFKFQMYQIVAKMEIAAVKFEKMANEAKTKVVADCVKRGGKKKKVKKYVDTLADFFVVPPLDADPYGILTKVEHLLNTSEDRFVEASRFMLPGEDVEGQADISMALKGVVGLNQIAKVVRHAVEMAKKMKNFQIALIIQMQLPMLEKMAKGQLEGTKAFLKRFPIGDAIGPYMAATLSKKKPVEIAEGMMLSETTLNKRKIYVLKAMGPGGRVGKPGDAVLNVLNNHKINRMITVDAAAKMEGEKTGTVAQGVGVAMGGGVNPERAKIEVIAQEKKIPIDAIAIKMSIDEAIMPLRGSILNAENDVLEAISESLERTPLNSKILLVGVGNTIGVGNTPDSLKNIASKVKKYDKKRKKELEKKRNKGFRKYLPEKWKKPLDDDIGAAAPVGMGINARVILSHYMTYLM
ncbi:DUF1512 family protein [Candidatus Undinarchaeota archaeon]